jgi:hypothetical protein
LLTKCSVNVMGRGAGGKGLGELAPRGTRVDDRTGARRRGFPHTHSSPPLTARGRGPPHYTRMEFLNFLLLLAAGWLVWRRPERERLAFWLLVVSFLLMALVFLIGTHTSFVPGVNL